MKMLLRHCYIVAKSGSGKSELIKLLFLVIKSAPRCWPWRNPVRENRTFLLLDPHGDVAQECARQRFLFRDFRMASRTQQDPNLVYIAPRLKKGQYPTINPFDLNGQQLGGHDLEVLSQQLSAAFAAMVSKGDVHLSHHMKTLMRPMIEVLLRIAPQRPVTFHDLARFLDEERNHDLIAFATQRNPSEEQRVFFLRQFPSPSFVQTKRSLSIKLAGLLNSRLFVELLSRPRSAWNLEDCLSSGKTIIVNASKSDLGPEVSEIYGRTIIALVLASVLRRKKRLRMPVFFVIDEAATFVSEDIKTILEESRKFGLHLVLVNQTVRQGGMKSDFHESVMGNTGLKIIGAAGSKTRREMARECETQGEHLENMKVGHFVVKRDGFPPIRAILPKFWVGTRNTVSRKQWNLMKSDQMDRFYLDQRPKRVDSGEQLREEIAEHRSSSGASFSGFGLPESPWPAK